MDSLEFAQETLHTMLDRLGFAPAVELDRDASMLRVTTDGATHLIGRNGERLEEIQYLVNRVVQEKFPEARGVKVDIDNYRTALEGRMIEEAEELAAQAVASGQPVKLEPMNSYQRRIIHNHFQGHPKVITWSPQDAARLKRITLIPRAGA